MKGFTTKYRGRWRPLGTTLALLALVAFAGLVRTSVWNRPDSAMARVPLLAPRAMTIVPGVHMLGGLEPSAAYVVETSAGLVLIDSGVASDARDVKAEMNKLGLEWGGIRAILLTHVHGDHCGGAEHLRRATGASVYAGAGDAPVLRAGGPREAFFSTFYRPNDVPHSTTVDVELTGNETIDVGDVHFRALGSPGHTPGSICYLMERAGVRVLFSGDVILMLRGDDRPSSPGRKPLGTYSAYLSHQYRGDAAAFLATLRSLRDLPVPDLVLPGHPGADPTPQSPRLSQERWESLLDGGITDMRILMDRFAADGRDFLDGEPKRLLSELYYLGEFHGASVYGFSAGSRFFLIDAPGGPGLFSWVKSRLTKMGATPTDIAAVLLTSCGSEATAGLNDLVAQAHARVVASQAGLEVIRKSCPPGTIVIAAEHLPEQGWFDVRVMPLRGRGLAPVAYSVKLDGKTVLFSGRIPIQFKAEMELALVPEISSSSEAVIDYLIAVNRLSSVKPELWLPAVSADQQNANIYDTEWENIIAFNYRVGYRNPRGPGGIAAKRATGSAAGGPMDEDSLVLAKHFTGSAIEPSSLRGLREAIGSRGRVGLDVLRAELEYVLLGPRPSGDRGARTALLLRQTGLLEIYDGRFADAAVSFRRTLESMPSVGPSASDRADLTALLGIAALRNCKLERASALIAAVGGKSPLEPPATAATEGQLREAVTELTRSLDERPDDLRIRWLLNLVHMSLGDYPGAVPPHYLVPIDSVQSKAQGGRFEDITSKAGLGAAGPTMAGASVFDDFNGDGLPDLLIASLDTDRAAALYINRGDGKFADRGEPAGLSEQIGAIRACAADYDNDGDLDVLLVRGAGEAPLLLSLLCNDGTGAFKDVTGLAKLDDPIAAASASWGDYDNDGFVDLYVCGEYLTDSTDPGISLMDPRNRSRLYHNQQDGTFMNVAAPAGVAGKHCAVAATWGDYDDDGRLDLFVSSSDKACRLYHNGGDGRFQEVAAEKGVAGSSGHHWSSCFFWDFDNDGRLDLLVGDGDLTISDVVAHYLGKPARRDCHPRLYRNVDTRGFDDISRKVGLDGPIPALSGNFGDFDNDGFLDVYFGAGFNAFAGLVPSVLLWNRGGQRFDDVSASSGTRRLQTAHSFSLADWNGDGRLDLVVTSGGATPGSRADLRFYQNSGPARNWLKVKLVGTKSNRSALGAKIHAELKDARGGRRSIYRTVGSGSACAGNSLVESIGLGEADSVDRLEVTWPASQTTQKFRDIPAGQLIEVTEGASSLSVIKRASGRELSFEERPQ